MAITQRQEQIQEQKLVQQQKLTQQHMMMIHLLEMPLTELEQSIKAELDDNPALETADHVDAMMAGAEGTAGMGDDTADEDFEARTEREEREDALDTALSGLGMDDEMPEPSFAMDNMESADYEEIVYGDRMSFYDRLKEQMVDVELTEVQEYIIEYIIGSLDSDGLLRKDTGSINDELAIYHNIDTTDEEIEHVIRILQTFDPPGIGARSLQECLLLQIKRRKPSAVRELMTTVISSCFDAFMGKNWKKIAQTLSLDDAQLSAVRDELLRLNPKPGSSLGETEGVSMHQITPDFIIDTADDGTISFTINNGEIPELNISPSFTDMIKRYQKSKAQMTRQEKEALLYAREKVERARGFIEAVKQRHRTLYVTMKAIIDIQRKYLTDGDEADLKPMILKDVADRTGLDISTVSRVSNMKYAQTRWGTFRLRHFFSDSIKSDNGEEMSTRKIKAALKDVIDSEDKSSPMSDDALKDEMRKRGYPVARRTIAKYREQMNIPVARLRRR